MPEDRCKRRPVEPAVVVHPPPDRRIHKPRDLLQRLVVPRGGQPPVADRLPDRLGGLVADRRQEAHEELPPSILRPPGPKGVAEEVELDVLMLAPPIVVLAVHDLGLLRAARSGGSPRRCASSFSASERPANGVAPARRW